MKNFNLSRRQLLKLGAIAGAGVMFFPKKRLAFAQLANPLEAFVDPLPIPPVISNVSSVDIHMRQFTQKLHRDLAPTKLWGYNGMYLGPTFEVRSGTSIDVQWINDLPTKHFLPIDYTLHGSETTVPEVRTVVHLHGAKVLPDSDGYPEAWFTHGFAQTGPSFSRRVYHYSNDQAATMLWYHDHALGITRLNVFAGLAGVYFIRDNIERDLPIPNGKYEVPLVFQDRFFNPNGSLDYPVQDPNVPPGVPPTWIPEFFGDTGLVNGKVFPYLKVEPHKYRFRMLNACNARFLHLTLANSNDAKETLHFFQIGADQGLLPKPVESSDLLIAPAERFDIVVDFRGKSGKFFTLLNDAPAPFPGGGAPDLPQLMQFQVTLPRSQPDQPLPSHLGEVELIEVENKHRRRQLLLAEIDDATTGDPDIGLLGTAAAGGLHWSDPVTEDPKVNSTEIWELMNSTTDAHPIHVHLVRFQVLNRQKFNLTKYQNTGKIELIGRPEAPDANERPAWKDVVKVYPGDPDNGIGSITRIIQKFELPRGTSIPPGKVFEYVWHCHILEHEDNDMMRPYKLLP